jgi:hypothetical protein
VRNPLEIGGSDEDIDQATWGPVMSVCVLCAQPTFGHDGACAFHFYSQGEDWAAGNRLMCDFVHRGLVPSAAIERDDAYELLGVAFDEMVSR